VVEFFMSLSFGIFAALGAGFAPTPEEAARKMMSMAQLRRGEVLYDLGCGDGDLLTVAAVEFGARAVGVEIQDKLIKYARRRIRDMGLKDQIKLIKDNFFKVDIDEADVVALYLTPFILEKLKLKLETELKPGARIVVYKYPVEGWVPKEVHNAFEGKEDPKIFLYQH
jgi:ribosomal protein L11 methylase PrmA